MALSLYDTASRKKAHFVPMDPGRAGIYTCGPTVYRYAHIGNMRTYLLTDLLVRALRFVGVSTFAVQNITDMGHMHEEARERRGGGTEGRGVRGGGLRLLRRARGKREREAVRRAARGG